MMTKPVILCIDDHREILVALKNALAIFRGYTAIYTCESAEEAEIVLNDIDQKGYYLAIVISDHVLPGKSGVDFLSDIHRDFRFNRTKKLLLTGLATHRETIDAINRADINGYIEKPWSNDELIQRIRVLLTDYVFDAGLDYNDFMPVLDKDTLYAVLRCRP